MDSLRGHAQSWGVKLVFGLIIVVFVFWGVGSFKSDKTQVLATVNGKPLLIKDFLRQYDQHMQDIRRRAPDLKAEDLKRFGFKGQVFNQMVTAELLAEQAEKLGVTVTKPELRKEIAAIPAFQGENRQFDKDAYERVLRGSGVTPRDFEERFAQDLLIRKVQALASGSVVVDEAEAKGLYDFSREQAVIDYVPFDAAAYEAKVAPTDEQVAAAYEQRQESLAEPAAMSMEYVLFTPQTVAQTVQPTDEAAKARFDAAPDKFAQPEEVKARHILVKVAQDAPEADVAKARERVVAAQARLKKEKFEDVAKAASDDPSKDNGGDLGWFERGVMVKPFEDAAFALQAGQVSEPVRSPFGWHLIKVEERREAGARPFEAVKDRIKAELAEEQAAAKITPLVDAAMDQIASGVDLGEVAKTAGLTTVKTGLFTRETGPEGLQVKPKDVDSLFALKTGEAVISPIGVPDGFLFARKIEDKPAQTPPLEQVRDRLVQDLKRDQAGELAKKDAEALAAALKDAADKDAALAGRAVKTSQPFTRQGSIPGLGMAADLAADAFAAAPGQWLDKAYQTAGGYAVVRAKQRIAPAEDGWAKEKTNWMRGVERMKQDELFQALLDSLHKQAEIRIVNAQVLND